jgi:hypothetical protein
MIPRVLRLTESRFAGTSHVGGETSNPDTRTYDPAGVRPESWSLPVLKTRDSPKRSSAESSSEMTANVTILGAARTRQPRARRSPRSSVAPAVVRLPILARDDPQAFTWVSRLRRSPTERRCSNPSLAGLRRAASRTPILLVPGVGRPAWLHRPRRRDRLAVRRRLHGRGLSHTRCLLRKHGLPDVRVSDGDALGANPLPEAIRSYVDRVVHNAAALGDSAGCPTCPRRAARPGF